MKSSLAGDNLITYSAISVRLVGRIVPTAEKHGLFRVPLNQVSLHLIPFSITIIPVIFIIIVLSLSARSIGLVTYIKVMMEVLTGTMEFILAEVINNG